MKDKKKKSSRGTIGLIMRDIGSEGRKRLCGVVVLIAAAKLCLSAAPSLSGRITDGLAQSAETGVFDNTGLLIRCLILALFYFLGYGVDGITNRIMVTVSQTLSKKLKNDAQKKLNRTTFRYLDTHPVGDILSRVTNDLTEMTNSLESTVSGIIGQFILLIGLIIMMLISNWKLALIYLIVLPIGSLISAAVMKRTNVLFRKQNETTGNLNALVSDIYSNHLLMKAYGCEQVKTDAFRDANQKYYKSYVKSRYLSGFVIPLTVFTNNFAYVLLCILGGVMLLRGELTIGSFQAFIFYGNMIGTPLSGLASSMNNIQTGLTSADRIYEFLAEEEEPDETADDTLDIKSVKGKVEFSHVKFGYLEGKELMSDVSFTAEPGQTMAIVGPSGAGKTTLVNLLMRFYEIWGGSIDLDGKNTRKLSKENLRSAFGMVLQDTWIFDGTIADNIGYGKPGATRQDIINAAGLVQCDSFIDKLPEGYDTYISDENSVLSAGEKQLLVLARAVIADPKILILDEATSQVDTKTEALITQAMEKLMEGRTSFIIAHRLYTIRNADKIIFMKDGDIKEVGSHDELVSKQGYYAAMYNSGLSAE